MTRFLVVLAAFALSGCAYSIQGSALPAPGVVASDAPKIPKPRKIANVDPCKLLVEKELKSIGPYKSPPTRQDDRIPESCQFVLSKRDTDATVVTAVYQKYEDVRARQAKGGEQFVDNHSTWVTCTPQGGDMVCTGAIAVTTERSLLVAIALRGASDDQVLAALRPLLKAALKRLPAA